MTTSVYSGALLFIEGQIGSFAAAYPKLRFITLQHLPLLEKHFKQGIAAYSVTNEGDFILIHQPPPYDKVSHPTMHIGIYENHAFLILDIKLQNISYKQLHLW